MKKGSLLIATLALVFSGGCGNRAENDTGTPPDGKALYSQYCKLCHGADGKLGLNQAANLASSDLSRPDLVHVITHGRNTMQPYEDILTAAEIQAVAEYVLTFREP